MSTIDVKLVQEQTRDLTLLYVEDDDDQREVTSAMLRKFFLSVDVACNGEEGFEKYKHFSKETGKNYDIVLTDIHMPLMTGITMAKKMRQLLWNQVIIMASSFSDTQYFLDIINLSIDAFVAKPMDHQNMLNAFYKTGKKMQDRRIGVAYHTGNLSRIVVLEEENDHLKAEIKKLKSQLARLIFAGESVETSFLPVHEETHAVPINTPKVPEPSASPAKEVRVLPSAEQQMLRQSFTKKTAAVDYVNDIGGDVLEEIHDLASLDDEWKDDLCTIEIEPTVKNINLFVDNVLGHYTHAINNLVEFTSLGYALTSLGVALKANAQKILEKEASLKKMIFLMEHLGHDLATWREHIFELQDTADIHYLDSSFFSSCMQIEGIISDKEIEADDDNDFELF